MQLFKKGRRKMAKFEELKSNINIRYIKSLYIIKEIFLFLNEKKN